jgi:hypothetical protein
METEVLRDLCLAVAKIGIDHNIPRKKMYEILTYFAIIFPEIIAELDKELAERN